jgi:hypothetical protein
MNMGIAAKLLYQKVSVGVPSNHAQRVEFKSVIKNSKVEGHIESASTPTHRFGGDVGDGTLGGIKVDDLNEIKNPVSPARDTLSGISRHDSIPSW